MTAWTIISLTGQVKEASLEGSDVYGRKLIVERSKLPKALRVVITRPSSGLFLSFLCLVIFCILVVATTAYLPGAPQGWQAFHYVLVAVIPITGAYIFIYDVVKEELLVVPTFGMKLLTTTSLWHSTSAFMELGSGTRVVISEYLTMQRFIHTLAVIESKELAQDAYSLQSITPLFKGTKPSLKVVIQLYNEIIDLLDNCSDEVCA